MSYVDSTRPAGACKSFFSALPHHVLDDPRLKPRDILTLASILRFARAKSWASMSNATLAGMGRCGERTIQLSLARCEATGHIRRVATAQAIGSATGRMIYLAWRETADCAPHRSAVAPPPPGSIAPEVREQRELETAPECSVSTGPKGRKEDATSEHSASPIDYAELGWLDRPASDPLRKLAERALAARLEPADGPKASKPGRKGGTSLLPPPRTLAGLLGRSLGLRG